MWRPPERIRFQSGHGRAPTREEAAKSAVVLAGEDRPARTRSAHLGSRHGALARDRRRLRLGRRARLVRTLRARPARAPSSSRRPASATCRAARCCASATIAILPGLKRLAEAVAARKRRAHAGCSSRSSTFSPSAAGPMPRKYFERFLRITDAHRRAVGGRGSAGGGGARAARRALRGRNWKRVLSAARMRIVALRLSRARRPISICRISAICRGAAGSVRRTPRGAPRRRASTASNCTTRTPTRWPRFSRAPTARDDGYGGALEGRVAPAARGLSPPCARRWRRASSSAAAFSPRNASRAATTLDDAAHFGVAFARAGMDFLSTSRGGKFDDAKQPPVNAAAYPYTGPSGYECMPQYHLRRARAVRPQRRADQGHPRRGPRGRLCDAGRLRGRRAQLRHGRGLARRRRLRHRRRRAPIARRSRLGAEDRAADAAPRCAPASSPIIARGSTRSTSPSPASSGTRTGLDEPGVARTPGRQAAADGARLASPRRRELTSEFAAHLPEFGKQNDFQHPLEISRARAAAQRGGYCSAPSIWRLFE